MTKTPGGAKNSPTRDYETGYCRPPKNSRIKKGQVLNPHGRNGKRVDEPDAFEKTRRRLSRVTMDGETVMLPSDEAYWLRTMAAAMGGDKTAARIIAQELGARRKLEPPGPPPPTFEELAQRERLSSEIMEALEEMAELKREGFDWDRYLVDRQTDPERGNLGSQASAQELTGGDTAHPS